MEFKTTTFELKADDAGSIEGYGSVFGNTDEGGDIVRKGAFSESLQRARPKMLFQHDPSQVLGVWDEMREDDQGLYLKGRLLTQVSAARDIYELVKAGAIDGLSIGYRTVEAAKEGAARVIEKAELWEVSLVTFPMNRMARIDAVKAAEMTRRDLERLLTQDAGLSRSVARELMAGGLNAVKAMQDAGSGSDELAELLKARLSL